VVIAAPDKDQMDVIDHRTGEKSRAKRNVLAESARIARGKIRDVASLKASEIDGVVLPGGFGAAKNLSTFAVDGAGCEVDPGVEKLLRAMNKAGKPIAALCIAPAVLAKVFGKRLQPELTIGNDEETAAALESMGATHHDTGVTEVLVDDRNRLVTTPCYMLAGRISDVATGVDKAVGVLLKLVKQGAAAGV